MPTAREEKHLRNAYTNMKFRCYDPRGKCYYRYGGRGIEVDSAWLTSYHVFREWALANGFKDGLTLDRIDNNKGYSPENCRFITQAEQSRNRCNTILVQDEGQIMCLKDWAKKHDLNYINVWKKYRLHGWTIEKIKENLK